MASKWKKKLKKVGKAAAIAAALYGATKLGRGRKKSVADTAATEGIKWTPGPQIPDIHNYISKKKYIPPFSPTDTWDNPYGAKEGGRIGAKGGGIAKRGMGAAYKSGGRVKSMGIAKRGGGIAKR